MSNLAMRGGRGNINYFNSMCNRPVTIFNVSYISVSSASKCLGISKSTIEYRCESKSVVFRDYYYSKDGKNPVLLDRVKEKNLSNKRIKEKRIAIRRRVSVTVDNITYNSLLEAGKSLNLLASQVRYRCLSENWINWFINNP